MKIRQNWHSLVSLAPLICIFIHKPVCLGAHCRNFELKEEPNSYKTNWRQEKCVHELHGLPRYQMKWLQGRLTNQDPPRSLIKSCKYQSFLAMWWDEWNHQHYHNCFHYHQLPLQSTTTTNTIITTTTNTTIIIITATTTTITNTHTKKKKEKKKKLEHSTTKR